MTFTPKVNSTLYVYKAPNKPIHKSQSLIDDAIFHVNCKYIGNRERDEEEEKLKIQ